MNATVFHACMVENATIKLLTTTVPAQLRTLENLVRWVGLFKINSAVLSSSDVDRYKISLLQPPWGIVNEALHATFSGGGCSLMSH